ncbi:hypothetical protein B484DRAFT_406253, partial [Ochromonadaceae sp. CCMP2298]
RKRLLTDTKRLFFHVWGQWKRAEVMYRGAVIGKFYLAWREEARTAIELRKLIRRFFETCIQRLKLTPQAVMAFFNPGEWHSSIAREDTLKIRRLILDKLFQGWCRETRELRIIRYKAQQILSRMVRRTKGPLWVKEAVLVCFHMWFRYMRAKKCHLLDLPEPRHTNPMLPQWTKLQKYLTVKRIKKKRCAEVGYLLISMRTFQRWKYLMTVD